MQCSILRKIVLTFQHRTFLAVESGIIGLSLAATVATRWFSARRGLVVGILNSSSDGMDYHYVLLALGSTFRIDWRSPIWGIILIIR